MADSGSIHPGRRRGVLLVLVITSVALGLLAGAWLAPQGQQPDPFGAWPWVYTVVPMSFLFVVTHPLLADTATLGAVFAVLFLLFGLAATQPVRAFRYPVIDRASLWILAVSAATFVTADMVLVVPNPYLNLLAALVIAWIAVGLAVVIVRLVLARRARARRASSE